MAVALSRFTTCLLRLLLFCFSVQTTIPVHIWCNDTNILKTSQFKLFVDGEEVARTETFFGAVAVYLEAFYVFNLAYPASLQQSLTFVQKVILNIQDEFHPTKPIITLTNKLNIVNNKQV